LVFFLGLDPGYYWMCNKNWSWPILDFNCTFQRNWN